MLYVNRQPYHLDIQCVQLLMEFHIYHLIHFTIINYEKYQFFSSENFQFSEVKFSIYLNRRVFVMSTLFALARQSEYS